MIKIINFVENINIVKALQLVAIAIFFLGILMIISSIILNLQSNSDHYWILAYTAFQQFIGSLFSPILLLALAEIIKLLKEKQND